MTSPLDGDDLLSDIRPITQIRWNNDNDFLIAKDGVTIEIYAEPSHYCNIPWLRAKRDGVVIFRMVAHNGVQVRYD